MKTCQSHRCSLCSRSERLGGATALSNSEPLSAVILTDTSESPAQLTHGHSRALTSGVSTVRSPEHCKTNVDSDLLARIPILPGERVTLERAASVDSSPRLVLSASPTFFIGSDKEGVDYACSTCSAIIASNIRRGQVRDIRVVCNGCSTELQFPKVEPGEPIPPKFCVAVLGPTVLIPEPISFPRRFAMLVGRSAAERYARETGSVFRWLTNPLETPPFAVDPMSGLMKGTTPSPPASTIALDARAAKRAEARLHKLLGPGLRSLLESSGGISKSTEPVHPLVPRIMALREAGQSSLVGNKNVDHPKVVEALVAERLIDRWKSHPNFNQTLGSLLNPTQYRHAIAVLYAASWLADAGNGVSLGGFGSKSERVPDLKCRADPASLFGVEVKVPEALNNPTAPLASDEARKRIKSALDKAIGSGTHPGQIRPDLPGLLTIAGFNMTRHDTIILRDAARGSFVSDGSQSGLLGLLIVNLGSYVHMKRAFGAGTALSEGEQVRSVLEAEPAIHPDHIGEVYVQTERLDLRGPGVA